LSSGQGPDIYLSSAAPDQKVSGASTIEEFNYGKSDLRVVAGGSESQFPGEIGQPNFPGSFAQEPVNSPGNHFVFLWLWVAKKQIGLIV
jgi:hypothetical protein